MPPVYSLHDLERAARRRLPASILGYVNGGSEDQASVRANRAAFDAWRFVPRLLTDVSTRAQSIELFGQRYASPVGIAPMGVATICRFDGDVALASAARQAQQPFVLSAASTTPMEAVVKANPDTWCQAYLPADPAVIDPWLQRVAATGVRVVIVTVDVPVAALRENELRHGFSLPLRLNARLVAGGLARPRWLVGTFARTLLTRGIPHFENFTATRGGPIIHAAKGDHRGGRAAFTWAHLQHIRDRWPGVLLVKGLLRASDAVAAQRLGVDGIVISNHGGRQLDGTLASLDALPAMVKAAPGLTYLLDGGVRRGTDVLKALALGARATLVGRPVMHGLAAYGQAGAARALAVLRQEIDIDLALLGCADVQALDTRFLCRAGTVLPDDTY